MTSNDALLHRKLGPLSLTTILLGNMVGSAWLFSAYYTAQIAGPLSLVSWVIAGGATLLIAVVLAELGITRPMSGGQVRWPQLAFGPAMGTMVGWAAFVQVALNTPSEAAAILKYGADWWPALFNGEDLNALGMLTAMGLILVFSVLNYFGVALLARVNNAVTVAKIAIPFLTVVLLLASGFDTDTIERGGGWAPYGMSSALSAVIGAGLVYAFGGIHSIAAMSGEARNPRRDIPLSMFLGLGIGFVLYFGLQLAFIGSVPPELLENGWHGINMNSPLAQLAVSANLAWLGWLLLLDGFVSPTGSLIVGLGVNVRVTYGLAENRTLPAAIGKVHARAGIPRRALILNVLVADICLVLFRDWQSLIGALGIFFVIGYAALSVSVVVLRRVRGQADRPWARGLRVIAPASFVISGMLIYWSGWGRVQLALGLFLLVLPLCLVQAFFGRTGVRPGHLAYGLWLYLFIAGIALMSALGSFGGYEVVPHPWDSFLVAGGSLGFYCWGLRAGAAWDREARDAGDRSANTWAMRTAER